VQTGSKKSPHLEKKRAFEWLGGPLVVRTHRTTRLRDRGYRRADRGRRARPRGGERCRRSEGRPPRVDGGLGFRGPLLDQAGAIKSNSKRACTWIVNLRLTIECRDRRKSGSISRGAAWPARQGRDPHEPSPRRFVAPPNVGASRKPAAFPRDPVENLPTGRRASTGNRSKCQ
jgi:hypothetical protein